jgi:2,4-dienoyl-CoA reductase (NADPH2)
MLELHGATGYLLAQFLSTFTNQPPGPWSGDFEQRVRFVRDVVRAVQRAVPKGFPIGYRLLVREWVPEGIDLDEAMALARVLEGLDIAYLSVSAGTYNSMFNPEAVKATRRPAYLLADTRYLRKAVRTPLIIGGRVFRPSVARRVLAEGVADMVGLGRPLLTDPGWLEKARTGRRVKVCIDCRHCLKRVIQEKGLACARWPEIEIERIDLECALQSRLNACLLFTSNAALEVPPASLPLSLTGPEGLEEHKVRLVYAVSQGDAGDAFRRASEQHAARVRRYWHAIGQRDTLLEAILMTAEPAWHDDLLAEARQDGFGMLVLVDGRDVRKGEILASKWREGVFMTQVHRRQVAKVFVAVDLSPATHVLLRFLSCGFFGGVGFRFVHILTGSPQAARVRWSKMLPLTGWDADTPLDVMPPGPGGVAQTLLEAAAGWDLLVVGRRGMSRIKSFLLGSVSRRVLRSSSEATVVIVS